MAQDEAEAEWSALPPVRPPRAAATRWVAASAEGGCCILVCFEATAKSEIEDILETYQKHYCALSCAIVVFLEILTSRIHK